MPSGAESQGLPKGGVYAVMFCDVFQSTSDVQSTPSLQSTLSVEWQDAALTGSRNPEHLRSPEHPQTFTPNYLPTDIWSIPESA